MGVAEFYVAYGSVIAAAVLAVEVSTGSDIVAGGPPRQWRSSA